MQKPGVEPRVGQGDREVLVLEKTGSRGSQSVGAKIDSRGFVEDLQGHGSWLVLACVEVAEHRHVALSLIHI